MVRKTELYCKESLGGRGDLVQNTAVQQDLCRLRDRDMAEMDTECGSVFQKESAFSGKPRSIWS